MEEAKKKLAPPPKKVIVAIAKAATASTAPSKVSSTMASSADVAIMSTIAGKRPRPPTKMIDDIAQTIQRLNKKVRKGEHKIFVQSS